MSLVCRRCNGHGFLNLDQVGEDIIDSFNKSPDFCDAVLNWTMSNEGHDVIICDCCGNGESWYGIPGEHYNSDDPPGNNGPYTYNGGLCECHRRMFVCSGKCRLCECGLETGKVDTIGKELFTGDIVLTFVQDENGCGQIGGLTVIVCNQFESYSNGDHKLIGDMEPFAMGIRDVSWGESDWAIMKLKDWGDVVDGEHWPDYGFMYTEI